MQGAVELFWSSFWLLDGYSHVDVKVDSIELREGAENLVWDLSSLSRNLRVNTCNGLNKKTQVHASSVLQHVEA